MWLSLESLFFYGVKYVYRFQAQPHDVRGDQWSVLPGSRLLDVNGFRHVAKKVGKDLTSCNDSLLLLCAIVLCVMSQQYPFEQSWLTVKVVALVAYIVLGVVALKRGKTKMIRAVAFAAALVAFVFTMSVARTHNPMGFLSLL